ncbi:MAG: hypothetical protein M1832_005806 [Thelocarpon impressellum]|nr:MAG: hypothetical protein M1832_005806 [Thelocarpon impressellum]
MSLLTDFVRISIWEDVLREKVDWATRSFWSYMLVQEFFAGAQYVVAPGRPPEPGVSEWRTTPECPVLFDRVHDLAALNVLVVV